MKKILALSLVLVVVFSAMLLAGNDERIGTAGAQELRIPVGSRGASMGGSAVANTYGTEALFWNPAGAALQVGTEAMFSHLEWFADMNVDYAAITTNVEGFGTIGASVKVFAIGDILRTTWDDQQGSAGEYFSPTFSVVGLTYARQFTDRVSFGASANLISEKIEQVSANGIAFDFGFIYNPQWRGLKFGVVLKNFGPEMAFTGANFGVDVIPPDSDPNSTPKTLHSQSNGFELPSYIQFGASWDLLHAEELHALEVSSTFQANNFNNDQLRGGVEYNYNDLFFLRGGYVASDQESFSFGGSFGAGLKVTWGAAHLMFDYTWAEMDFFDNNQWFTVKLAF